MGGAVTRGARIQARVTRACLEPAAALVGSVCVRRVENTPTPITGLDLVKLEPGTRTHSDEHNPRTFDCERTCSFHSRARNGVCGRAHDLSHRATDHRSDLCIVPRATIASLARWAVRTRTVARRPTIAGALGVAVAATGGRVDGRWHDHIVDCSEGSECPNTCCSRSGNLHQRA